MRPWDEVQHGPCCKDEQVSDLSESEGGNIDQGEWQMVQERKNLKKDETGQSSTTNPYSKHYEKATKAQRREKETEQAYEHDQRGSKRRLMQQDPSPNTYHNGSQNQNYAGEFFDQGNTSP